MIRLTVRMFIIMASISATVGFAIQWWFILYGWSIKDHQSTLAPGEMGHSIWQHIDKAAQGMYVEFITPKSVSEMIFLQVFWTVFFGFPVYALIWGFIKTVIQNTIKSMR